jgi:phytoene dehydrogenase-like protein
VSDANFDVAVVGAGFGGLAAALTLAERGARVALFESLTYPGGCASTFQRKGWRFEAGATLFSGLGPGQWMRRWIDRYALPVRVDLLDEPIELRSPLGVVRVPGSRAQMVARLADSADFPRIQNFFAEQGRVADALWALFDDPTLLPPWNAAALLRHARRLPAYVPLARHVGRSLGDALRRHRIEDPRVRLLFDALCQITVQVPADEAEATFALAATDYAFRGAAHVHGGIGQLAGALVEALRGQGAAVHLASRVSALRPDGSGWSIESRGRTFRAGQVVANVLPQALAELLGHGTPRLERVGSEVEGGYGAVMLYLGLSPAADLRPEPHHLQLVADPAVPLQAGNHIFCSVSGSDEPDRGPGGARTATVSTHLSLREFFSMDETARAQRIADIQQRMRATLSAHAPELDRAVTFAMTASPRTWERFTRRPRGFVGGVPRRVGLSHYLGLWPRPVEPGLWMVGDSGFPGQSTLAVAVGGHRVAEAIAGTAG